jgi:hypothetical protein
LLLARAKEGNASGDHEAEIAKIAKGISASSWWCDPALDEDLLILALGESTRRRGSEAKAFFLSQPGLDS